MPPEKRQVGMVFQGDALCPQVTGAEDGQQQRVALARALVSRPSLLLLDEPLSALDKTLRESLQEELKALHDRLGLTFVYVTHDQQEALSLSDEVAILNRGGWCRSGRRRSCMCGRQAGSLRGSRGGAASGLG